MAAAHSAQIDTMSATGALFDKELRTGLQDIIQDLIKALHMPDLTPSDISMGYLVVPV